MKLLAILAASLALALAGCNRPGQNAGTGSSSSYKSPSSSASGGSSSPSSPSGSASGSSSGATPKSPSSNGK